MKMQGGWLKRLAIAPLSANRYYACRDGVPSSAERAESTKKAGDRDTVSGLLCVNVNRLVARRV